MSAEDTAVAAVDAAFGTASLASGNADIFDTLIQSLSVENLLLQTAVIVIALALGFVLSQRINAWLISTAYAKKAEEDEKVSPDVVPNEKERELLEQVHQRATRLRRFALTIVRNVSFSLVSWIFLTIGDFCLLKGFDYEASSLLLTRAMVHILFAFAVVRLISAFFTEILGHRGIQALGLQRAIIVIFWLLVVLHFFGVLDDIIDVMETTRVPFGGENVTIWTCFVAIITVLLTIGIADWAADAISGLVQKTKLSASIQIILARVIRIICIVLAIVIALSSVGLDLSVLSVFSGALGVGLGFGLQKIASNYISGFIILFDRSIKIGDMVETAGFRGRVTEINTRFTVVRNNDGVECIVPNESFVTTVVKNYSYTDEASVQYIDLSVAYDSDLRRALAIMLEEGMRPRPRIVPDRRGWAYVDSFGDDGVHLKLGFWCKDPVNGTASLRTEITLAIMDRFAAEGIVLSFSQFDINILNNEKPIRFELSPDAADTLAKAAVTAASAAAAEKAAPAGKAG